MERVFLIAELPRGNGPVSDLPAGPDVALPAQTEAWIAQRAVTSLLVLRNGEIVHESYHLETAPEDRRIGWSIAKSYLSALLGVILAEGHIASLDDPVTRYVPALAGGAYDGASIREVAQMSSGVAFNEDYLDYHSDINRMGRVLALGGSMDGFAIALSETFAPPGERWAYVSIDTHVLAMVIRAATGRDIPSLMSEKIIQPLGFETTPYYLTDGQGVAFALGGLNATTRDHARFGLMIARDGRYGDRQVVPGEWIAASTRRSAPTAPGQDGYGFQWWIPVDAADGVVVARGIYGQYIYIDRNRDVVIVTTAADRAFREPGVHRGNVEMFRAIADIVG
jgi:CubicO group peptidase (beta-lactamase class C family)